MRRKMLVKKIVAYLLVGSILMNMPCMAANMQYVNAADEEITTETNVEEQENIEESYTDADTTREEIPDENDVDADEEEESSEVVELEALPSDDNMNETSDETCEPEEELLKESDSGNYDIKMAFDVLTLVNKYRVKAGAASISMDLHLYQTAELRAKEITEKFSHTRPDGTGCFTAFPSNQVSMGENLAQGYATASSVMYAWMKDDEHKSTILNKNYKSVGIACYYVPGSQYGYYWVQCFGDTIDTNIYLEEDHYTTEFPAVYNGVDYSAVYDYNYYIKRYPSLLTKYGNSSEKIFKQFINYGISHGKQASADFNVYYYKNRYVDLRNLYGNDLTSYYLHYIQHGRAEGRNAKTKSGLVGSVTVLNGVDYSVVFDYNYYINHNEDVKALYNGDDIGALTYFVNTGMEKGHQAIESFDVHAYACKYYSLRKQYKNDLKKYYLQYMRYGCSAGKTATGVKVMKGGPTAYKGINYSPVFSVGYYAYKNPDLFDAFGYDDAQYLKHFINLGMKEGRLASKEFVVLRYKKRYPDLLNSYGNDLKKYYIHYIEFGKAEGRIGN